MPLEHARAVQPGQQFMRGRAAVLVEHGVGHVVQVEGRGVAEDQALHDRRHEQGDAAARILQDRQQLLADQGQDAQQGVEHGGLSSSDLRIDAAGQQPAARRPCRPSIGGVGQDHAPDVAGQEDGLQQGDEIARRHARS